MPLPFSLLSSSSRCFFPFPFPLLFAAFPSSPGFLGFAVGCGETSFFLFLYFPYFLCFILSIVLALERHQPGGYGHLRDNFFMVLALERRSMVRLRPLAVSWYCSGVASELRHPYGNGPWRDSGITALAFELRSPIRRRPLAVSW